MTKLGVALVMAAAAGTPAFAQTTDCLPMGRGVQCHTFGAPARSSSPAASTDGFAALGQALRVRRERAAAAKAQAAETEWRAQLGAMVADGKCREAIDTALRAGDLKTAGELAPLCPAEPPN